MENVDGVLLVDKDPDMTSHDVVSVARRTLGQKKNWSLWNLGPYGYWATNSYLRQRY